MMVHMALATATWFPLSSVNLWVCFPLGQHFDVVSMYTLDRKRSTSMSVMVVSPFYSRACSRREHHSLSVATDSELSVRTRAIQL
jgi:hypothetical protein